MDIQVSINAVYQGLHQSREVILVRPQPTKVSATYIQARSESNSSGETVNSRELTLLEEVRERQAKIRGSESSLESSPESGSKSNSSGESDCSSCSSSSSSIPNYTIDCVLPKGSTLKD